MKRGSLQKRFLFSLGLWLLFSSAAWAQSAPENASSETVETLFGSACERIKPQESVSSIRMRATDKATFDAVQNLETLISLHDKYNDHDWNVLIYNIVDNYVEDLGVQTTQQNEQKICVEVTGYVSSHNIAYAIEALEQNQISNDETSMTQTTDNSFTTDSAPLQNETEDETNLNDANEENTITNEEKTENISSVPLLYIAPLEFFNQTSSKEYVKILEKVFYDNAYFQQTDNENDASYVIYSKVLKAKVDAINSNTYRMQMVVSVEVKNKIEGSSAIEHQNRFILFDSSDDEQKVAANLMQKLLTKAGKLILNKVEKMAKLQTQPSDQALITPQKY